MVSNRPFYSCWLGDLAFEWQWGWSWPCFDTDLTTFIVQKPKIKHTTMIGSKIKGRLDLPDFEIMNNALKITWLKRLHQSCGNASWSHIPLSLIKEVGGSFLFEWNYDLTCLKVSMPIKFYKDVLHAWQTINQHIPENKEQILNKILWNNRLLKSKSSLSITKVGIKQEWSGSKTFFAKIMS